VLIVMSSEIIGFGLASFLQVPMTDITLLLISVVIGVGVDDVIAVVDYFDQEPVGPDQLPNSLSKARPAIFPTYVHEPHPVLHRRCSRFSGGPQSAGSASLQALRFSPSSS
jgi:hypothetical protein